MNTLYFKYALEIDRTRSITKAAENLFMAQPNLSKAVKELEHEMGFTIFERNTKGVIPTKKGVEFLKYAQKILNELEHIKGLIDEKNPKPQNFSISLFPQASYITEGFTRFAEELDFDQGITINIQETSTIQTINGVAERRFNLGIIRYQTIYESYYLNLLVEKDLNYEPLWEFDYVVLMSKNHPLAEMQEVLFSNLEPFIEILYEDTVIPYLHAKPSPSPETVHQRRIQLIELCNQFDFLTGLPQTYMLTAPIPDKLLRRYELIQRKCQFPHNQYKDMLIYHKNYTFTNLDKQFINKYFEARNEVSLKQYH